MPKTASRKRNTKSKKQSSGALLSRFISILILMIAILFVSAGRLDWIQAWVFVAVFGGFLVFYALRVLRKDPGQKKERSQVGQNTKNWDKTILIVYSILLVAMLVLAGLDAGRFGWAPAAPALQALGWLGAAFTAYLIFRTGAANTFLSRTVRIQKERGHQVVDSGPYAHIRHPMYTGVIVLMLSVPLLLGSLWALIPGFLIGILFIIRTALEDRTLRNELPGYAEYAARVRYRLFPWIW